jgi:hypothetical protein
MQIEDRVIPRKCWQFAGLHALRWTVFLQHSCLTLQVLGTLTAAPAALASCPSCSTTSVCMSAKCRHAPQLLMSLLATEICTSEYLSITIIQFTYYGCELPGDLMSRGGPTTGAGMISAAM